MPRCGRSSTGRRSWSVWPRGLVGERVPTQPPKSRAAFSRSSTRFEPVEPVSILRIHDMPLLDPNDARPIHFVGIAGAGMSALAELFIRRGVRVTGCDANPEAATDLV